MTGGPTTVRVLVSGRVQGVGFRAWTGRTAAALGLSGWVRNRRDGRVEAVFTGPAEAVARMLDACRRGPAAARVEAVETFDDAAPERGDFAQRPTVRRP